MRIFNRLRESAGLAVLFLVCVISAWVLIGCSGQSSDSLTYYNPVWSSSGGIYAVKETIKSYSSGGFVSTAGQDRHSYIVIMDSDGKNESILMDVGVERYPRMNASPSGNYLAMTDGHGLGIFDVHNGYAKVSQINVDDAYGALTFFDWSPDEGSLIINTETGHIGIYSRGGVGPELLSSLEYIYAWKYNEMIVGQFGFGEGVSHNVRFVESNNTIVAENSDAFAPIEYFSDGQSYFGGGGSGGYKKIGLDFTVFETYTALKTELDKEPEVYDLSLNPAIPTQLLFSQGSGSTFDTLAHEGIFTINLDGTGRKQVK